MSLLRLQGVGGIKANNNFKAEFLYQNLAIQNNIIHASHENQVKKLLFLGSACIWPRNTNQPIKGVFINWVIRTY